MAGNGRTDRRGLMMMAIAILLLTLMGAGIGFAVGLLLGDQKNSGNDKIEAAQQTEQEKAASAAAKPESTAAHGEGQEQAQDSEKAAEELDKEAEVPLKDLKVVPLPPILTTLAEPKGKWIRLEGALLALPSTEKTPELLAEETGEQILAYLRTLRLKDIETPSGFLGLRDDLNETVKVLSNEEVRAVLIHGLIVE